MWDLPGPGLEPVSPELAGGFLTTAPSRSPQASASCLQQPDLLIRQTVSVSISIFILTNKGKFLLFRGPDLNNWFVIFILAKMDFVN